MYVMPTCVSLLKPLSRPVHAGIGEVDWAFRTTFTASEAEVTSDKVDLVFDGLDTFAAVELVRAFTILPPSFALAERAYQNGHKILEYVLSVPHTGHDGADLRIRLS